MTTVTRVFTLIAWLWLGLVFIVAVIAFVGVMALIAWKVFRLRLFMIRFIMIVPMRMAIVT